MKRNIAAVSWSGCHSVGVPLLDEQHRAMSRIINRLVSEVEVAVDGEVISDTLTELTRYTQEHFELEEQLMRKAAYPELEEHQQHHESFVERVAELSMETLAGRRQVPDELLDFLVEWWQNHVTNVDMRYRKWLAPGKAQPHRFSGG